MTSLTEPHHPQVRLAKTAAEMLLRWTDTRQRPELPAVENARVDHLAARELATRTLHEAMAIDPAPADEPWHFSLAHAGGVAVCAATKEGPVGVDVESLDGLAPDLPGFMEVLGTEEEQRRFRELPVQVRPDWVLALWTAKEAYLKAIGAGILLPFHRIDLARVRCAVRHHWIAPGALAAVVVIGTEAIRLSAHSG